jgi:flavin-dependent dehydrogenase
MVLRNGSRIVVIGAGPAGVFFADRAMELARKRGLDISVLLFDGKDFTQSGPKGCNLCAGVISETLVNNLKSRGIVLPDEKVQRKIDGYYLRMRAGGFELKHPQHAQRIITVYRGNGPRESSQSENVSFDDYLLERVLEKGPTVMNKPVKHILLPKDNGDRVRIIFGIDKHESTIDADLVVGAFGLSTHMMDMMKNLNFGYRPPRMLNAQNIEIGLEREYIEKHFGNNIFAFNWSTPKGMLVAGIIPKRDYITVNLIGEKDMRKNEMLEFLDLFVTHKLLPANWNRNVNMCHCSPRIAVSAAKKPYTNRLVIIGDASCSRYYKNGIESAFVTAQIAAETALTIGISESAFKRGYFRSIKKVIIRDNYYGRILFQLNDFVTGHNFLSKVLMRMVMDEEKRNKSSHMRSMLWNMYTGNTSYKVIFMNLFNPRLQWNALLSILEVSILHLQSLRPHFKAKHR